MLGFGLALYGGRAATLYDDVPMRMGFAHLRRPAGGFLRFIGRNILIWLSLAGIGFVTFIVLIFVTSMIVPLIGDHWALIALLAGMYLAMMALGAAWGLSLPATVAGDADATMSTALERAKGRIIPLAAIVALITAAAWRMSAGIELIRKSLFIAALPPAPKLADVARLQKEILFRPDFVALGFVKGFLQMASSVFIAAALSTAYLDAKKDEAAKAQ